MEIVAVAEITIAVCTLGLAIATVYLGVETRALARETAETMRRADFQHQEALTPIVKLAIGTGFGTSDYNGSHLSQPIVNRGSGPALKTTMLVDIILPDGKYQPVYERDIGPLGPQEEFHFGEVIPGVSITMKYAITFRYENLFGAVGTTMYVNSEGPGTIRYQRPPILVREDEEGRFNTYAATHSPKKND